MNRILLTLIFVASSANLALAQCSIFYDGFESGSTSPTWTNSGGSLISSVVTSPNAAGSYALSTTGGSGHLLGIAANFAVMTPDEISWYIYPNGATSNNYLVAGDAAVTANNCIVFSYWQGSTGNLRFVSSLSLDFPVAQNTWHFIQLKNVDYVNRTFDLYLDGALQYTAFPFRSTTISTLSVIHLYNFNGGTAYYDEILAGNEPVTFDLVGTNVTCNGNSDGVIDATVTNSTGPVSYMWSNMEITEDISGLAPGMYTLTVTDSVGCVATDSLEITEPSALGGAYDTLNPTTCQGTDGSISLYVAGGTPGYAYNWNTGDTTDVLNGLSAGNYTVDIVDTNGCMVQWNFTLEDPEPPVVSVAWMSQNTCTYYIPFSLSGGQPSGGNWSGVGVNANMFDPGVVPLGSNVLTYTYTDSLNCTGTATAEVIVDECLELDALSAMELSVYPNPASNTVNIKAKEGKYALRLMDLSGQEISEAQFTGATYQLSLSGLAPGVYHLEVSSETQGTIVKLMVQ
jgi:hypothetical protein